MIVCMYVCVCMYERLFVWMDGFETEAEMIKKKQCCFDETSFTISFRALFFFFFFFFFVCCY